MTAVTSRDVPGGAVRRSGAARTAERRGPYGGAARPVRRSGAARAAGRRDGAARAAPYGRAARATRSGRVAG
ncbi:hypothetical protein [Streptosporangium sandarakinum]